MGFSAMNLVGWAEKPYYDKASHKLYWAQELHVEGGQHNSLNYNVRVLGRHGVLVLNAVSSMRQISDIKSEMRKVIAFSEFTAGNRYADFDSKPIKLQNTGLPPWLLAQWQVNWASSVKYSPSYSPSKNSS